MAKLMPCLLTPREQRALAGAVQTLWKGSLQAARAYAVKPSAASGCRLARLRNEMDDPALHIFRSGVTT